MPYRAPEGFGKVKSMKRANPALFGLSIAAIFAAIVLGAVIATHQASENQQAKYDAVAREQADTAATLKRMGEIAERTDRKTPPVILTPEQQARRDKAAEELRRLEAEDKAALH